MHLQVQTRAAHHAQEHRVEHRGRVRGLDVLVAIGGRGLWVFSERPRWPRSFLSLQSGWFFFVFNPRLPPSPAPALNRTPLVHPHLLGSRSWWEEEGLGGGVLKTFGAGSASLLEVLCFPTDKGSMSIHSYGPDGVLLVDKPAGCTSHDVVDFVRKRFGFRKVGHCGTLDPRATGLLLLTLERGTKIQDLLMSEDKCYEGTMRLGITTDSQDADGQVTETREVPAFTQEQIAAVFQKYRGDISQLPPMVSAIKKGGVPLYKLARAGKVVEREPRRVTIYSNRLVEIALPDIKFFVECSKGFYVRTFCYDVGQDLGCGAHLLELRRTKSGVFDVSKAVTMPQLEQLPDMQSLKPLILSLPEVSRIRRA